MRVLLGFGVIVTVLPLAECRGSTEVRSTAPSGLGSGIAARVGSDAIASSTVVRIAREENVGLDEARGRAVADALFAAEARSRYGSSLVKAAERRASARVLLDTLAREADEEGPPTDPEVDAATERRFWELDCPALLRTTHAAVLVKDPKDDARARALAERILVAVEHATDPQTFRAAAQSVPAGGLTVRVEDLLPVARDGRAVDPSSPPPPGSTVARYSDSYVRAAFAIPSVGQVSPVVHSEFGYHVILAVALLPERRTPLEERRRMLAPEILVTRKQARLESVLARAREIDHVTIDRAAEELSEKARVVE